ncbi:hypothetical protein C8R46DRAFT_1285422 [Mycena filopes]|nr:hypothetical protein C8R46DRAFT_1285422 [Mycena filopes]
MVSPPFLRRNEHAKSHPRRPILEKVTTDSDDLDSDSSSSVSSGTKSKRKSLKSSLKLKRMFTSESDSDSDSESTKWEGQRRKKENKPSVIARSMQALKKLGERAFMPVSKKKLGRFPRTYSEESNSATLVDGNLTPVDSTSKFSSTVISDFAEKPLSGEQPVETSRCKWVECARAKFTARVEGLSKSFVGLPATVLKTPFDLAVRGLEFGLNKIWSAAFIIAAPVALVGAPIELLIPCILDVPVVGLFIASPLLVIVVVLGLVLALAKGAATLTAALFGHSLDFSLDILFDDSD